MKISIHYRIGTVTVEHVGGQLSFFMDTLEADANVLYFYVESRTPIDPRRWPKWRPSPPQRAVCDPNRVGGTLAESYDDAEHNSY